MEIDLKVRMSPELIAAFSARDEEGNLLTLEKGEPDAEGFYCPIVTRHDEDNPLRDALAVLDDVRAIAAELRADWLGPKKSSELEKSWPAMKQLIDFVEHGGTPKSWRAWLAHHERQATSADPTKAGEPGETEKAE